MNNAFYVLQKYNPFIKKWEFLDSNSYETLEEAQSVVEKHKGKRRDYRWSGDQKLRIVKLGLLSIIEEKPHL